MLNRIIILILFIVPSFMNAQYDIGKHIGGASVGFSFLGSAAQFGLNYEYGLGLNEIGISGPGKLGVGGIFRYWSYTDNFVYGKLSYTDILIGAQGNYHFFLKNQSLDPWVGLILAFDFGSVKWESQSINSSTPSHGGLWLAAHAGLRYWINEQFAISTRLGFGTMSYGALDIGVDYKF